MAHAPRPWTISAAYVGAVAGAGFGSGRELLQFFAAYGHWGLAGCVLAGASFTWLGSAILGLCRGRGLCEYGGLFREVLGPLAPTLDLMTTVFLFAGLGVVLAGAGALGADAWGWPPAVGAVTMAGTVAILLLAGRRGMLWGNAVMVPLLTAYCVALAVRESTVPGWGARLVAARPDPRLALGPWYLGALLYVGYNVLLAAVVLCAAAPELPDDRGGTRWGAVGGGCLGVLILTAVTPLLARYDLVAGSTLPLARIAALHGPAWSSGYILLLGACLFTTALASAHALGARLARPSRHGAAAAVAIACALPLARLGLPMLVRTLYPAAGAVGVVLLGALLLRVHRQG